MSHPAYLTAQLPGTGGVYKEVPEDFQVDEILEEELSGKGEHLYVHLEKRGVTTHDVAERLGRAVRLPLGKIGYAGLKDARAVARQWFSIPTKESLSDLERNLPERVRVLETTRHRKRLRLGQLRGNRFRIVIRHTTDNALDIARNILAVAVLRGIPNLFGEQRFGTKGDTDQIGRALLAEDYEEALRLYLGAPSELERDPRIREARELFDQERLEEAFQAYPPHLRQERRVLERYQKTGSAEAAMRRLPKNLRFLFLSAYQSRVFNHCLLARIDSLDKVLPGDIIVSHPSGVALPVLDVEREQQRVNDFEVSPSGPLFGPKLRSPKDEALAIESTILAECGVHDPELDSPFRDIHLRGERRAYRFPVHDASVEPAPEGICLNFTLDKGCYATSVLREIIKPD